MNEDEAVMKLDSLASNGDAESDHDYADSILVAVAPKAVREAWERARERVGFWYA